MSPPPSFGGGGPAMGLGAIQDLAVRVGNASGGAVARRVVYGLDPGPTCLIRGRGPAGIIEVNPRAARQVPLNSWAFILGHEFAHQITGAGPRGTTSPEIEQRMDLRGAGYARRAGFRVADHVAWVLSRRDDYSPSHGSSHRRAEALAGAYGIRPEQISGIIAGGFY